MSRSIQRSVRLDENMEAKLNALPKGTVNGVINQLLELFFNEPALQSEITQRDSRLKNWDSGTVPSVTPPAPGQTALVDPKQAKPVDVGSFMSDY